MSVSPPDGELLAAYVSRRSEAAFGALVERHAGMVYATAVRQVGDSSLAEEIAQNTFVVLARKAPQLRGNQTLAGWLHRTVLLEAKAGIRKELRRRRREETAAILAGSEHEGDSPTAHLIPLLDEALLDLRDGDRQALILRFLEECSLRDVGAALGVEEDAARKRVARALDRVGEFFREKGFAISSGTATTAALLLGETSQAMPAAFVSATTQAALASTLTQPGLSLAGLKLMALTKTQTAAVTILLAAVPLAWQWRAQADVTRRQIELKVQTAQASNLLAALEQESQRQQEVARRVEASRINAELRLAERRDQLANRQPTPVYQWNDAEPLVRVPKQFVAGVSIQSVSTRQGKLSEKMAGALQLTEEESRRVQVLLDRFLTGIDSAQAAQMQMVPPRGQDLKEHAPEEVRVFEFPQMPELLNSMRDELFSDLHAVLGPERFPIFQKGLRYWMPLDNGDHGTSTGMAVVNSDHRYVFFRPEPGSGKLSWRWEIEGLGSVLGMRGDVSDLRASLPSYLSDNLQDWIELAKPLPEVIVR